MKFPFPEERNYVLLDFKLPKVSYLSDECNDLLSKMICKNPINRITAQDAVVHPWIIKMNKENVAESSCDGCASSMRKSLVRSETKN